MASENLGDEDTHHRNFVRWYGLEGKLFQEDSVEILLATSFEATIRTVFALLEKSTVYIKTDFYSGNGIVTGCYPEQKGYRTVIQLDCEEMLTPYVPEVDPGVLALDGFLTEEEEAKILESLSDDPEVEIDDTPSDSFNLADLLKSALTPVSGLMVAGIDPADTTVQVH